MARFLLKNAEFNWQKEQNYNHRNLNDQNGRYAVNEVPMSCFMAKRIHTNKGTDAATDQSNDEQGGFGDPPEMFFGFLFIQSHTEKTDQIDKHKIGGQKKNDLHELKPPKIFHVARRAP